MEKTLRIFDDGYHLAQSHKRIGWVDNAKALGIILVVFAHTKGQGMLCDNLIYCFHMPLFFFLSGYLLKDKYLADRFQSFIWRSFRLLIIPYISFWMVSFGFRMLTAPLRGRLAGTENASYVDHLYGFIFGVYEHLDITNGPLWFLTCLFCTMTLFYWLSKIKQADLFLSALALLGLVGPVIHRYMQWRLPWNMELALVAVVFFGIGHILSKTVSPELRINAVHRFLTLAILAVALVIAAKMNGRVSMARMRFGNYLLYYLGAFSGIGLVVVLSQLIRPNTFFEWLSRNTIVILATHAIVFTAFKGLSVVYLNVDPNDVNLSIGLLYTTGMIALSYPISFIIVRYFPLMVGNRVLLRRPKHPFHLKELKNE